MKIETGLNHRNRALRELKNLWNDAAFYKLSHSEILTRKGEIFDSVSHCPGWVKYYLNGADSILFEKHYEHLEFCHLLKGILYSTHKETDKPKTERLYKKNLGSYLSKHGQGDFYYKGTNKRF